VARFWQTSPSCTSEAFINTGDTPPTGQSWAVHFVDRVLVAPAGGPTRAPAAGVEGVYIQGPVAQFPCRAHPTGMHRILRFLRAASPNLYCHDCLARSLGIDRETVRHETVRFVKTDGVKAVRSACSICRGAKTVVTAA
jgi:hypothetical protein